MILVFVNGVEALRVDHYGCHLLTVCRPTAGHRLRVNPESLHKIDPIMVVCASGETRLVFQKLLTFVQALTVAPV